MEDGTKKTQSAVAFQRSAKTFTQALYPSDIKYNFVEDRQDADKFKVYVVYRISVKNNTTHNLPDIYKETALHLTSLTDSFDSYRYELNKDDIGDNIVKTEMEKWNNKGNNIAEYTIPNSGKAFDTGLNPNETESTYIQFKVTDECLREMVYLSQEEREAIYKNSPSVAGATGYHMYTRYDKNWKDKNEYQHRTINDEKLSGSIGIIWKLADTRKISGVVFEDSKVDQLEGEEEKSRKDERIGNGKLDINEDGTYGEKTISGVIVSLMDADSATEKVAKVYNGDLIQGEDGKWRTTSKDAIVQVKDDGSYVIPDVVPGRYYLKFAYGNGETEYTDINGNKIKIESKIKGQEEVIKSYLYKSTILTAKNAKSENEKTWFLDSINEGVYSVATDSNTIIGSRIDPNNINTELNYYYTNNLTNSSVTADSPIMNIQFEYIPENEINANIINDPNSANPLRSNCTGMSFGIIERPRVNIELEKTIKNIKLTLQNGTNIINGNPEDNAVSPYLSSIGKENARIEIDSSYIYGSNAVVTYSLQAHNRSELDYATVDYYKYGIKANNVNPVTVIATKMVDYLNNQNATYDNQSENARNAIITLNNTEKENYFSSDVIAKNKNYKQTVFTTEKELLPEVYDPNDLSKSSTDEFEFTVNNLLSTSDGILGWESYAEIIGIKNITLTPQSISKSGNYIIEDKTTLEPDTANATISIYNSTGENKNLIIYFVIGGALIVIAVGVVLIKKFVI